MLFLLQIILCSRQLLEHNLVLDLRRNTSDTSRTVENDGLCKNVDIQQNSQEFTKAEDKNLSVDQSDSNLLNDLKDFAGKDLNRRHKNVDCDLCSFPSLITAENNLMTPAFTRNTVTKHIFKKQYCTLEQSRNDTARLKISNSIGNDTADHSYINMFWNDNTYILSRKT